MKNYTELEQLINVNSYTKNKSGVDRCGEHFKKELGMLGFECDVYEREMIGNHLHFKSTKENGAKILLLGHLDTVFPEGSFDHFSEDSEWVYGPGVCDMKGGNLVALNALRNLHNTFGGIKNIDFLLVSDEESGSDDSKIVTFDLSKVYDYCFVFEAAGKNEEIVVARKGVGTYFVDIKGRAAHAGNHYQNGLNANLEAARVLISLTNLTNLQEGTTVNVGKMEGGIGANTISPSAKLTFEIRYTKSSERDRVIASILEIVNNPSTPGIEIALSGGIQRDVMEPSEKQLEFISLLEEALGVNLPTEKRGGVSDANIVSSAGVVTLDGFGPYGDGDHTVHERALKQSLTSREELMTKILTELCYKR